MRLGTEYGTVLTVPSADVIDTPGGINLVARAGEIRRIVGAKVRVASLDADDLLQEVYLAILRKNGTASAFDPSRSSFSHYIVLVARSTASHMLEARCWR